MSYVFDSSSLIYFGKIKLLEKIDLLEGKKFIPKEVYEEVVERGLERNEPEAQYVNNLIKKKVFVIRQVEEDFINADGLSMADAKVLSLAKETKSIAVIDEIYANSIAESYGIESHGSIYIIFKLIKKKIISKKEAVRYLDKMISLGFYLSAGKYREVLDFINRI